MTTKTVNHAPACPAFRVLGPCTCGSESSAIRQRRQKALKLLEALSEECNVMTDGDHAWRTCRACLAREELDHKGVRAMLRDLLTAIRNGEI